MMEAMNNDAPANCLSGDGQIISLHGKDAILIVVGWSLTRRMVRLCYQDIANSYQEVKAAACGRQACSVMIMVAYEVDAMASCKMLTQLLRSDNIGYTIRPVLNFDEVIYNYQSFMTEDIKTIFMINCGALYNIPKVFDLETGGDVRCFILDNHRPIHLANLYSRHSVVVFDDTFDPYDDGDDQNIPCDGSDLSGGLSSSDDDSASTTSTGNLDEEDLFDEELQEADIHAAFGREEDEEAELEDEDAADKEDGEGSQAEEVDGSDAEVVESEGEGEDLGSDEERSVDEEGEGEGESEDSASTDAGDEADVDEGEADVTVEYDEGGLPTKSGKRKHRGVAESKRGSKKPRASRARAAGQDEGAEAGLSDSDESGADTRPRKGKKGTRATAAQVSSRASYPIGAAEGEEEGEGVHDVTAEEGWAVAEAQRSHRRRTTDLAALADEEAEDEGERDPMYDQDDVEEGEGEEKGADRGDYDDDDDDEEDQVQIRGRRRREAEEVVRARERKHELQSYYSQNARYTAPTALMLIELLSAQLGSRQMPTEVLWQAVLGVTYQYTAGHLPELLYSDYCSFLKGQFGDALRSGGERNQYAIRANEDSAAQNAGGAAGQALLPEDGDMMLVPGSENGYVEEAAEYRFFLYRHWSLYDAMYHSPYVASKLGVWNPQGTVKLQELLARMGVPLNQCRQSYQYMAPSLRSHFTQQISDESILEAYGFTNPGVTFKSFYRYNSFKNPVAASDIVHAATALVEMYGAAAYSGAIPASAAVTVMDTAAGDTHMVGQAEGASTALTTAGAAHKITSTEAFYEAYSCLGMRSDDALQKGIQAALDLQRTLVKKASAMMDGNASIHRCHRLYYAYLSRSSSSWGPASGALGGAGVGAGGASAHRGAHGLGDTCSTPVEHTFGRPMVLAKLGQYIMDIKRNVPKKNGGWQGSALLPFVLLSEKADGSYIVVGISPLASLAGGEELTAEQQNKLYPLTNFKQFFKLAGQLLGAQVRSISFDANVVEVGKADVQEFLGALDDSLRKATPRFNAPGAGAVTA